MAESTALLSADRFASEEAWEVLKTGAESAWSELKSALDAAVAKFK